MSADGTGGSDLQFDKVDLAVPGDARACRVCRRTIDGEYFEIAGNVICAPCATHISGSGLGRGSLGRAALFGAGAALLATVAWYAITKISGYQLGIVAIVVGLFVGRAVRKGGGGLGGWRYQALAMALTYVSITAGYVPLIVASARDAKTQPSDDQEAAPAEPSAASARGTTGAASLPPVQSKPGAGAVVVALALVLGLALASPFLGGASNIMGIIIIGIGLYEAWKTNRRVPLSGPFRFGTRAAPIATGPAGGPTPPAGS